MNFKGIPYKTEWVEYPDIEALCKKIGAPATAKKDDGTPMYTVPAIYDPSTKTAVADSILIAEYLDATYPDTPKLFPPGSHALQLAALYAYDQALEPLWQFAVPATNKILNPHSEQYFRRTRELIFGKTMEDLSPTGKDREVEWAKVKEAFGIVDAWLQKSDGPYFMGNTICFIDLVVASFIIWSRKVFGEASAEWADLRTWNDGRWGKLMDGLEKYAKIV